MNDVSPLQPVECLAIGRFIMYSKPKTEKTAKPIPNNQREAEETAEEKARANEDFRANGESM
jgi:hypothetical protein